LTRFTDVVKVDSKGRVTIPLVIREAMDIREGRYLIMVADVEKKEIALTPISPSAEEVYEIRAELKDRPGALADFAARLKEVGFNLLIVRCTTLKKGEIAECTFIAEPLEARKIDVDEARKRLEKLEITHYIVVKPLGLTE